MKSTISYMICATPRSGSTLLCEALRNTGLAGYPDEYFGPMHVARWTEKWQTRSDQEYLEMYLHTGEATMAFGASRLCDCTGTISRTS